MALDQPNSAEGFSTNSVPVFPDLQIPDYDLLEEPSHHELQSKASISAWEGLRNSMLLVVTESCAMPVAQVCSSCASSAEFWCQRCGPVAFYCYDCFNRQHRSMNIFHVAERREVGSIMYI